MNCLLYTSHRGQYGLTETVDAKTGKVKIGTARVIRNTLPNATYIGFTGKMCIRDRLHRFQYLVKIRLFKSVTEN